MAQGRPKIHFFSSWLFARFASGYPEQTQVLFRGGVEHVTTPLIVSVVSPFRLLQPSLAVGTTQTEHRVDYSGWINRWSFYSFPWTAASCRRNSCWVSSIHWQRTLPVLSISWANEHFDEKVNEKLTVFSLPFLVWSS